MTDCTKIKLVIWDLDGVFWDGTLSEGGITPKPACLSLAGELARRGIINAACSKNDQEKAAAELERIGAAPYFVFNSIDWTPKGQRIASMLKDMGLRPANVLFIDDNTQNLAEAGFYCPGLMTAGTEAVGELRSFTAATPESDPGMTRLESYRILEKKRAERAEASDNIAFLRSCGTVVEIRHDCEDRIDRIAELVARTNQLNYTKVRSTRDELLSLVRDPRVDTGYINARDRFGDYGTVGFYALKDGRLIHFLFSCRTIGQGLEQYVYATLGYPGLEVSGEVVSAVDHSPAPDWISSGEVSEIPDKSPAEAGKILFKGPCDMDILTSFLNVSGVRTELTYISPQRHNSIEHQNHSVNFLTFPHLTDTEKKALLEFPFNDEGMFETSLYDRDLSLIFLSTLIEPNLGVYRNRKTGRYFAFGEWTSPLTDESNWDGLIDGSLHNYKNRLTREDLAAFASEYEFTGRLSPARIEENIRELLGRIAPGARLCLILGSEMPYSANTKKAYEGRETFHKELNPMIRKLAASSGGRLLLIDFNEFLDSQDDFLDNINHFQRRVYFKASRLANSYIEETLGYRLPSPPLTKRIRGMMFRTYKKIQKSLKK